MDDDEAIAVLMNMAGDGIPIIYNDEEHPFISNAVESEEEKKLSPQLFGPRLSLIQRTDKLKPHLPPCVTRATKSVHSQQRTRSVSSQSEAKLSLEAAKERHQTMNEFIQQKRDLYVFQVIINRKKAAIRKFQKDEISQEKHLSDTDTKIFNEAIANKQAMYQLEADLARARRLAESAAQKHSNSVQCLNQVKQNVEILKSSISKNEDLKETYIPYRNFLKLFCPPDGNIWDLFTDPSVLIEELHKIENENLFIIKYFQQYEGFMNESAQANDIKIDNTKALQSEIQEKIDLIGDIPEFDEKTEKLIHKDLSRFEEELIKLKTMVGNTYQHCFGSDTDIPTLEKLEKIENVLEEMFKKSLYVSPEFVHQKELIKAKMRREQQRKETNERKEKEQQMKFELAISRAKKPIPRRTGRPFYERRLPIHIVRQDDEEKQRVKEEMTAEDRMLFGDTE